LTVCVVVVGRHVPNLSFLQILLSDEEMLAPHTRFYQRLLAMDLEEATAVAEEFIKGKSLEELYDMVIVPALIMAEEDRHRGRLDEERRGFVFQNIRQLVENLAERADELVTGNQSGKDRLPPEAPAPPEVATGTAVVCIPARDEADEISAVMLAQLLTRRGVTAKALPSGTLAGESLEEVAREHPVVACVSAIPPFGYTHARYLCGRLRARFQHLKLVGAILTEHDPDELRQRQPALQADELGSSIRQVLAQVLSLVPLRRTPAQASL
jgi:hypothetical protein